MPNERKIFGLQKNIFFTGLVSFFMDVSSEMIYPLVPVFLSSVLGVNKSLIGLIEGIAESTASLLKVFSGWLSDRLGNRKSLMLAGYAVSTLSRPLMATAGTWHQILAARFVDRLGKGVRTAPRDAIIAESAQPNNLALSFSFHRSMDTLGAVAGPGIAWLLLQAQPGDFRLVFWLSMLPGMLAVLVIICCIHEKKTAPLSTTERPRLSLSSISWRVKLFIGIAALFALGNSSDAFLILRAQQVGVAAALIPVVYLTFNLIYSLSGIPAGMAADRFGMKKIIVAGFVLFAGLYYGFAVVETQRGIWLLFAAYGVFMGLTEGIQKAYLASISPAESKATTFGVFATAVGLMQLPSSLIAGLLWDHVAPAATFYFGAATAALSAVLFATLMIRSRAR